MKTFLLFTCATLLLATTGCIISDDGYHGYRGHDGNHYHGGYYHSRATVMVPAPVILVPAVRVRVD